MKEDWMQTTTDNKKQMIGEHVDYSGYGVLPMALDRQDTVMAVHVADAGADATEDTIILNNLHNRHVYGLIAPIPPSQSQQANGTLANVARNV